MKHNPNEACPDVQGSLTDVIVTMHADYDNGLQHYADSVAFAIYATAIAADELCVPLEDLREHLHILYELARRLGQLHQLLRGK